ncbi:transposase [uncultured Rhodospira sp.]|uniref:IS66 family transposase n=1 Tax=uncultured Rhodospira sp. TaxID=1936189 RepID=UPI0026095E50|nr:transposase [uncultured Rhodospira sp.]
MGRRHAHGVLETAVILSDDAGQFNVGEHASCWVHAERLVHKLDTFTEAARHAKETVRSLIWRFYTDLKAYRAAPMPRRKAELKARFARIFRRRTGFVTLGRLLARLRANRDELLRVLDRPEIPLHTNGSENDIRCHVTRRKVSATTHSDHGRDCRDAFLGLNKTCRKLGVSFWDDLHTRLGSDTLRTAAGRGCRAPRPCAARTGQRPTPTGYFPPDRINARAASHTPRGSAVSIPGHSITACASIPSARLRGAPARRLATARARR